MRKSAKNGNERLAPPHVRFSPFHSMKHAERNSSASYGRDLAMGVVNRVPEREKNAKFPGRLRSKYLAGSALRNLTDRTAYPLKRHQKVIFRFVSMKKLEP